MSTVAWLALLASLPLLDVPPKKQTASPRDLAVVIGISDYAFIDDVPYADRDARAFATYLAEARGVPRERIRLLLNGKAVRETIEAALQFAADHADPAGTVWFFYAGHGVPTARGDDGVLTGADVQQNVESFEARGISRSALIARLAGVRARQTVALLDACFSGKARTGETLAPGLRPLLAVPATPAHDRVLVFSAAANDEVSGPFDRARQGLFTYFAIGGLRGWADANGDKDVTVRELHDYVRGGVGAILSDGSRSQSPNLNLPAGHPGLELALARNAGEAAPELGGLIAASDPVNVALATTPAELAQVPELRERLRPGGALRFDIEPDILVAYDRAVAADRDGSSDPQAAVDAWNRLHALEGNNPFRNDARARALEWQKYALHAQQREKDTARLKKVLPLASISLEQKAELLDTFASVYGGTEAAKLVSGIPDGATRAELCKRLPDASASVHFDMPFRDLRRVEAVVLADGARVGHTREGAVKVPACSDRISVVAAGGDRWEGKVELGRQPLSLQPRFWDTTDDSFSILAQQRLWEQRRPGALYYAGTSAVGGLAVLSAYSTVLLMNGTHPFGFDTCCQRDRQALGLLTGLGAIGFGWWTGHLIHAAVNYPPRPAAATPAGEVHPGKESAPPEAR